ncbi:MAG: LTA synthase family protein [Sulfurimonas sp.]|nr:LTA synthase family protein [Sulfurimonas sp.]
MQKQNHFSFLSKLLFRFLELSLAILAFMSLVRLYIFITYSNTFSYDPSEALAAFWLGVRLDASIVAYINSLAVLLVFFVWVLRLSFLQKYLYNFFRVYFVLFLTLLSLLTFMDLAYLSYFGEHSTLMIFGVFDDDTTALLNTAFANYNIPLFAFGFLLYFSLLYFLIFKIIRQKDGCPLTWNPWKQSFFFLFIILSLALLGRGSLGLFPLAYNTQDVSADPFLNCLPQTSTYALLNSYEQYEKSKSGNYDLIKTVGYQGKIEKAFEIHKQTQEIDKENLLGNIHYKTPSNELLKQKPAHVVVVMVESFGMPLLDYQSESFNIMGKIKKHFEEDTLFTRFISSSNGTIVSLEPLLLNITARPSSTSFAQSEFLNTEFTQASARVYQNAGYETSFVYGGDLSWRNVGNFVLKQGFEHVAGKAVIANALGKDMESISHDWGVFDGYLYQYIEQKLQNATKPQFIYVLTTNNHPPYKIPQDYTSNRLEMSEDLKNHITGEPSLMELRFKDYAYAVDMAGEFLDNIKGSALAKNTVVAFTADNNTIEGNMRYDNYYTQTKRIPFYLYLPQYLKPKKAIDTLVPSSHKDIFPTLYNLTLSDADYTAIGTNLLDANVLHCGFNDAGVIMSQDGGFEEGKAMTPSEQRCQEYYKASLAVTEFLIQSQK